MPDARLKRARGSLPTGYQFGDAGSPTDDEVQAMARVLMDQMVIDGLAQLNRSYDTRFDNSWKPQ